MVLFIFFFLISSSTIYSEDKFAVITAERTGTHLLTKALALLTGKEPYYVWERMLDDQSILEKLESAETQGKFFHMHAFPEKNIIEILESKGYKIVFHLRDPRDNLISVLFYVRDVHWHYGPFAMENPFGELSFNEQIEEMITGERFGTSVPEDFIIKRLPWTAIAYTTRFENLVGEKGGGSKQKQVAELKQLAAYLHIQPPEEIENLADKVFGGSGLVKGQIGSWKEYFTEKHIELFKQHFGDLLISLEYETDLNW